MKNIINKLSIILVVVLLHACVKKVEVDIPYAGDKITMFSYINQDSNVYVRLSKSQRSAGYNNFPEITNGTVTLLENGTNVATFTNATINNQNWYLSNFKAKPNKTYTVKATAPNLTAVEGTETMVSKAKFKVDSFYLRQTTNATNYYVKLNLNDPIEENFYLLRIYNVDTNTLATGPRYLVKYDQSVRFIVNDIAENTSPFDILDPYGYTELFFSDAKFNGKLLNIKLDLDGYYSNGINNNKIAVVLKTISKSFYRYNLSLENQINNTGNPFSEPSQVFSNIKNGYGLVATSTDSIYFKRQQ